MKSSTAPRLEKTWETTKKNNTPNLQIAENIYVSHKIKFCCSTIEYTSSGGKGL